MFILSHQIIANLLNEDGTRKILNNSGIYDYYVTFSSNDITFYEWNTLKISIELSSGPTIGGGYIIIYSVYNYFKDNYLNFNIRFKSSQGSLSLDEYLEIYSSLPYEDTMFRVLNNTSSFYLYGIKKQYLE